MYLLYLSCICKIRGHSHQEAGSFTFAVGGGLGVASFKAWCLRFFGMGVPYLFALLKAWLNVFFMSSTTTRTHADLVLIDVNCFIYNCLSLQGSSQVTREITAGAEEVAACIIIFASDCLRCFEGVKCVPRVLASVTLRRRPARALLCVQARCVLLGRRGWPCQITYSSHPEMGSWD